MATTPNDLTRQQLDELDALLQRMLSVPAAKVEPAKPPVQAAPLPEPPSGWRADLPAPLSPPHLSAQPTMALAEPRQLSSYEVPEAGPAPAPFAPTPLRPLERPSPPKFVAPPEKPLDYVRIEQAALASLPSPAAETPSAAAKTPMLSPMLWPLFAVNWLIETILKLFGPPGEMLTSRPGKNLLATLGILMILGAGLWAAQGQGWIALPLDKLPR